MGVTSVRSNNLVRSPALPWADELTKSEFLGPTSFSAAFSETRDGISNCTLDAVNPSNMYLAEDTSNPLSNKQNDLELEAVEDGVEILHLLADIRHYRRFIEHQFQHPQGVVIIASLIRTCIDSIAEAFDPIFAHPGGCDDALISVSKNMFEATKAPPAVDAGMSPQDFCSLFTGQSLRWEILGLIFALVGISASAISDRDSLLTKDNGQTIIRRELVEHMLHVTENCLSFCVQTSAMNDFVIWLMYESYIFLTMHDGDASESAQYNCGRDYRTDNTSDC